MLILLSQTRTTRHLLSNILIILTKVHPMQAILDSLIRPLVNNTVKISRLGMPTQANLQPPLLVISGIRAANRPLIIVILWRLSTSSTVKLDRLGILIQVSQFQARQSQIHKETTNKQVTFHLNLIHPKEPQLIHPKEL